MRHYHLIGVGLLFFSITALALEKDNVQTCQSCQEILPYDVDQTLQTFTKTVHGGIQHVVVKSPGNTKQIKLVQTHLLKMANDFRKGDFSDTERMHGANMPGLAQLKTAKTDDIKFEYKALENGAQIHYTTEYPEYVQALHFWFDAQIKDHGNDKLPEHSKHHSTPTE